jgi:multiple sugar transport system substrate-binding protein
MARDIDKSRRSFLQQTSTIAAAGIGTFLIPRFANADKKNKLRILQWNHFVPQFDQWFKDDFIKKWSVKNDTEVIIDNVGMTSLKGRADAQVKAGKGHDLFMFLRPPPTYEDYVIDHREVYEECKRRYGTPSDIALKSTYNPKTKKYFGFSDSYVPDPVNYRKDLWDDVGIFPSTWENILEGGTKIYKKHGIPLGLGLAPELDSNMGLRSILHSFGSSVQNADGRIVLDSHQTIEAVKFVKALYQNAMTEEVLSWDPSSNNRMMLSGQGSLALNAISITRTGETQKIPVSERIWLTRAAAGPAQRIGLIHLMHVYVIWKFAKNIDGAKQFLVDYVSSFRDAFLASRFYNLPCFPETVPDLKTLVQHDAIASPNDKYSMLADVPDWTTAVGYPGYANAVIDETFSSWVISSMFADAARGRVSPEAAVKAAHAKTLDIYGKWQQRGKI